jgi:hypothetical protein
LRIVDAMLPFSREAFLAVFAQYNVAIWPAQTVAAVVGCAVVVALWRRSVGGVRVADAGLALMWAWTGMVYHGIFFARINPAAIAFAALFVVQGALLARAAWRSRDGVHDRASGFAAWFGWALIVYAGLLYPLVGALAGHVYPAAPVFGVTPCPVTLFTFGAFLLGPKPVPRHLLAIPLLWALIGGSAAFLLDVVQDWPLLVGGLAAGAWSWRRGASRSTPAAA